MGVRPCDRKICFDSSAARGFFQAWNTQKKKQIHYRTLWIQLKVRNRAVKINPVDTQMSVADIGTKYLGGQRMAELLRLLPVKTAAQAAMATGANAENTTAALAAFAHKASVTWLSQQDIAASQVLEGLG
eukprot:4977614-Amphidinium_carterae.1